MDNQDKIKAEKVLEIAKKIKRKVVFLKRGVTGYDLSQKKVDRNRYGNKKLNHEEVLKMIKEGIKSHVIAKHFKVTSQAIVYIRNKYL